MAAEGRIFDAEPHPDERVEWLRAQVEEYVKEAQKNLDPDEISRIKSPLVVFVRWMEERFMPRGFFDR